MAFEIFDRAGDSTGGVKDEKGLWLAYQSTGNSTCGRAYGTTVMLCFVLLNSLMSALFLSLRRRNHMGTKKRRHCLRPWSLTQPGGHISLAMS